MIIEFEKTDLLRREGTFGGEGIFDANIFNDGQNKAIFGRLEPGASIGFHKHETGSELMYIISGTGYAIYDGEKDELRPGVCHYCPIGHSHSTVNTGKNDMIFFAVVTKEV